MEDHATAPNDAPQTVTELTPGTGGRWEVRARSSRHVWDLDLMTYTRLRGPDSEPMEYDGMTVDILRVERWPAVGGQSVVVYDDPFYPALEQWRRCSIIQSIVALPPPDATMAPSPD
jgi:hypothetical protein